MKKYILLLFSIIELSVFGQVNFVALECKEGHPCLSEMKTATVHVIIKDFCDDSKPYKKILEENWRYSNLKFDWSEKYENNRSQFTDGEWYMYLDRSMGSTYMSPGSADGNRVNSLSTSLCIAKAIGKKNLKIEDVIEIPLYPSPGEDVGYSRTFITQEVDVSKCFFNLGNEYYLKNILQVLNQFVDNKISFFKDYNKTQLNCESVKEILGSTLYIPQYVLVKTSTHAASVEYVNPSEYFQGYESNYKILTNDEMIQMFKASKPFYYLLWAAEGNTKYNFIIEGTTGKIMSLGYGTGYNINKKDMPGIYEKDLKNRKNCK